MNLGQILLSQDFAFVLVARGELPNMIVWAQPLRSSEVGDVCGEMFVSTGSTPDFPSSFCFFLDYCN